MTYEAGRGGRVAVANSFGLSTAVSITAASGRAITVYTNAARTVSVAMPDTTTTTKQYYLDRDDAYVISVQVNSTECGMAGTHVTPVTQYISGDTTEWISVDRELAQETAASLPPDWLAGIICYIASTNFVLAESPNGKVYYPALPLSSDALGADAFVAALAYNGTEYLMAVHATLVAAGHNLLFRSTDAHNWVQIPNPFSTADVGDVISTLAWFKGKWYAGSGNTTGAEAHAVMVSADGGLTWATQTTPFDAGGGVLDSVGMAVDANHLVAVGFNTADTAALMYTTGNGTWTEVTTPFSGTSVAGIAANGTVWVATGSNADASKSVMTAPTGDVTTWTEHSTPLDSTTTQAVGWGGTKFWACAPIGTTGVDTQVASSVDGVTWADEGQPLGADVSVAAIGANGTLLILSGFHSLSAPKKPATGWSDDHGATWHLLYPPDPYWSFAPRTSSIAIPPY